MQTATNAFVVLIVVVLGVFIADWLKGRMTTTS